MAYSNSIYIKEIEVGSYQVFYRGVEYGPFKLQEQDGKFIFQENISEKPCEKKPEDYKIAYSEKAINDFKRDAILLGGKSTALRDLFQGETTSDKQAGKYCAQIVAAYFSLDENLPQFFRETACQHINSEVSVINEILTKEKISLDFGLRYLERKYEFESQQGCYVFKRKAFSFAFLDAESNCVVRSQSDSEITTQFADPCVMSNVLNEGTFKQKIVGDSVSVWYEHEGIKYFPVFKIEETFTLNSDGKKIRNSNSEYSFIGNVLDDYAELKIGKNLTMDDPPLSLTELIGNSLSEQLIKDINEQISALERKSNTSNNSSSWLFSYSAVDTKLWENKRALLNTILEKSSNLAVKDGELYVGKKHIKDIAFKEKPDASFKQALSGFFSTNTYDLYNKVIDALSTEPDRSHRKGSSSSFSSLLRSCSF